MLITLTGPTGSGKSTLAQALSAKGVLVVPTWTTRPLRPQEAGRGDIARMTRSRMTATDMLETAEYEGNLYGTPMTGEVKTALAGYVDAVKIVEPQGLAQVRETLAQRARAGDPCDVAHVYIDIDAAVARERLLARCSGAPSDADERRLARVEEECASWREHGPWTLIINNSEDGVAMADLADQVLEGVRLEQRERAAAASDQETPASLADRLPETALLLSLMRQQVHDDTVQRMITQGQEALDFQNQPLVRAALDQLRHQCSEGGLHPMLRDQLDLSARELGLTPVAEPVTSKATTGQPPSSRDLDPKM